MEWVLIFALVSGLGNVWQYGETRELQTQLKAAYKIANACQAARQDTRDMEILAAYEREEEETIIRGIFTRSELDTRELNTASDQMGIDSCSNTIDPTGRESMEVIIKRAEALNNQWLHSTSEVSN